MNPAGKRFEDDDPFEPVAAAVTTEPGYDGLTEMGRVFVQEFASMGWKPALILRLFRDPFYQGPYLVYRSRGEAGIRRLVEEVCGPVKEDG